MKKFAATASLLVALFLVAFAQPQADPVTLRWKLAPGQVLRYRLTYEQEQTTGEMVVNTTIGTVYHQEVREVSEDGVATIDLSYEAMRMSMQGPVSMEYDSTRKGDDAKRNSPELTKMLSPLLDAHMSMKLEPTGKIVEFKGLTEALEKMLSSIESDSQRSVAEGMKHLFDDDSLRQMLEFNVFPTEPVAVEGTWKRKLGIEAPFGTIQLDYEYVLKGVETHDSARIANIAMNGKMAIEKAAETAPVGLVIHTTESDLSGTTLFSVDSGRLTRLDLETAITMKLTMDGPSKVDMESKASNSQVIQLLGKDDPAFE